jgi:hypothetical protein
MIRTGAATAHAAFINEDVARDAVPRPAAPPAAGR